MPTSIKAALKKWEEATGRKAGESKEIKLIGVYPPIEKMEGPFHLLINCEKFSLSTNQITNISNLQAFKTLKVLSLGRNLVKSLQGIEGAAESLEQLWISYNQVDRLKPIRNLLRLKVLYMSHNYVREWREFEHLTELPCLEDLVFIGNPLEEDASANGKYQEEVTKVMTEKFIKFKRGNSRYINVAIFSFIPKLYTSEAAIFKETRWLPSYTKR